MSRIHRKGDIIVSGGKSICPGEVEDVLYTFPGIIEAIVIGVPDHHLGEAVKALIVMREGITVSGADIIKFCGEYLEEFKKPSSVQFCKELPGTLPR